MPKVNDDSKKYTQKYKKNWESKPEFKGWLSPHPGRDDRAFCKCCKTDLRAHSKDLKDHAATQKHKGKMAESEIIHQTPKITNFVHKPIDERQKIAELKIAVFIAEHCSTKTSDHLGEVIRDLDDKSELLKSVQLHRTKCSALLMNVISPCMFQELLEDLGDSFYSLLVDESTTVDTITVMAIMIRYYSARQRKVVTTFYRLIELEAKDAQTMYDTFLNIIEKDGLKICKLLGIGTDNENSMTGEHNSFTQRIKRDVPHAILVRCACHSLHLCAEHAFAVLPKYLDFLIRETTSWFTTSAKRQVKYKKLYNELHGSDPLKTSRLSGTRWLARINTIKVMLEQWETLRAHFSRVAETERCYTAEQLSMMYGDVNNKMYLTYIYFILKKVVGLNRLFQSDQVDPLKLSEDLHDLMFFLLQQVVVPQQLAKVNRSKLVTLQFEDYMMSSLCMNFGYDFNSIAQSVKQEEVHTVKDRLRFFVRSLCQEVQARLPENMALLESMKTFSLSSALKFVNSDITNIAAEFESICENVDETVAEWNMLCSIQWDRAYSTEELWVKISEMKNSCGEPKFKHISDLVLALLTVPFSNAAVERCFSILNIIKDKLRNRMAIATADCILRIRYGLKTGCQNFQPTAAMLKLFNNDMYHSDKVDDTMLNAMADVNF